MFDNSFMLKKYLDMWMRAMHLLVDYHYHYLKGGDWRERRRGCGKRKMTLLGPE